MMKEGLVHIYCGDGKGKTTAALGLTIRAAGSGMTVVFVQFFKDGKSAEFNAMAEQVNIILLPPERTFGFSWTLTPEEKQQAAEFYTNHFRRATELARLADLLVLDEIIGACNCGAVPEAEVLAFLQNKPAGLEVVLTGRNPSQAMVDAADYVTEMRKIKHPFDRNIGARPGIEY